MDFPLLEGKGRDEPPKAIEGVTPRGIGTGDEEILFVGVVMADTAVSGLFTTAALAWLSMKSCFATKGSVFVLGVVGGFLKKEAKSEGIAPEETTGSEFETLGKYD